MLGSVSGMTAIEPTVFRSVMSLVPTCVVVVTGYDSVENPVGVTIGSFTSVSLEPPLVGFFPGLETSAWLAMRDRGMFCVNVLTTDQVDLCWDFARSEADPFEGVSYTASPNGMPLLEGVKAWIDCDVYSETVVGDHYFVSGQVTAMGKGSAAAPSLVFYLGETRRPTIED